jgi:hypothetical protein
MIHRTAILVSLLALCLCQSCRWIPRPWVVSPPAMVFTPPAPPAVAVRPPAFGLGSPTAASLPTPPRVPSIAHLRPVPHVPHWPHFPTWHYTGIPNGSTAHIDAPAYTAPRSLTLRFGEPTIGTDEEICGTWAIDPRRSAAIMKAWLTHIGRAYGSHTNPDVSELEQEFRKLDARLTIRADRTYSLALQATDRSARMDTHGNWHFADGVLRLSYSDDIDGIPVEGDAFHDFSYYRNAKFTGFVAANHGLGLVFSRG